MLAHQAVAPSELAGSWTFEPVLLATLAAAALVHRRGRARLGRRIAGPREKRRAVALYTGLMVLAGALMSPLDALAHTLFSGHMAQHLLLMMVAAPLLVYARPTAALVAGLPAGGRDMVRRSGLRGPNAVSGLRGTAHALARPVVVWISGTLALWAWHMPALYEAALAHEPVHVLEHASFLGVALLFWSVVLSSGTRRGVPRPIAIVLVFASGVQGSALGAVLLFASTPLYNVHTEGARVWDVSPLSDQQLAGALMWSPPALLYIVVMGWLLVRWFDEMDDASPEPLDRLLASAGEVR
jgi:cytochrome c oxidase assembly factor CtaG